MPSTRVPPSSTDQSKVESMHQIASPKWIQKHGHVLRSRRLSKQEIEQQLKAYVPDERPLW
jgi:hypothetical protein